MCARVRCMGAEYAMGRDTGARIQSDYLKTRYGAHFWNINTSLSVISYSPTHDHGKG
jgi:hypothetical protein